MRRPKRRGDDIPSISDYAHWNEEAAQVWYLENRYDMEHADEPVDDDSDCDYEKGLTKVQHDRLAEVARIALRHLRVAACVAPAPRTMTEVADLLEDALRSRYVLDKPNASVEDDRVLISTVVWIPLTERLPDYGRSVLLLHEGETQRWWSHAVLDHTDRYGHYWLSQDDYRAEIKRHATHWAEVPLP